MQPSLLPPELHLKVCQLGCCHVPSAAYQSPSKARLPTFHPEHHGNRLLFCRILTWQCLQPEGYKEMTDLVAFYKENATILRNTFTELGFEVHGGENAPYVWIGFPGQASWDVFSDILTQCNIVTTPGSGFGPAGEGFVRASAFGHR